MPRWPHAPTRPQPTLRKRPRRSKPSFGSSQRSADPEPEPEPEPDEPDPDPEPDTDPEPEAQHTVLRLQPEVHAWKKSRGA